MAIKYPAYGQLRAANELRRQGIILSPGGVRSVWQRHGLETFKKRLKALEVKVVTSWFVLPWSFALRISVFKSKIVSSMTGHGRKLERRLRVCELRESRDCFLRRNYTLDGIHNQ